MAYGRSARSRIAALGGLKICICTPDYMHLVRNGGIGTSFQHTISVLAPMGADITVLYANLTPGMNDADRAQAVDLVRKDGAKLEYLFPEPVGDTIASLFPSDIFTATSYAAYQWLKVRNFDVVIFADWRGIAYYAVHAKRQGLALTTTQLWIQAHSTALWHELNNQQIYYDETNIRVYHYERKAIELCDRVLGATQYLLNWMTEHGFVLPVQTDVYPLIINDQLLANVNTRTSSVQEARVEIAEIVFFGRLEKRKGLLLFLQALQRLAKYDRELLAREKIRVTFLGKITMIDGINSVTFIERELKGLGIDVTVNPSLTSSEAVAYLHNRKALAIMPSLTDNSPLTVHECINAGIPFIATRTGGIPELIHADDHTIALVEPSGVAIANRIAEIIAVGQRPIRSAIDQVNINIPRWVKLLQSVKASNSFLTPTSVGRPLVSICVVHYERPALLKKTLDGLLAQTYKNFEIILVDNDSRSQVALDFLNTIKDQYNTLEIRLERLPDLYAGAARNKALSLARGDYIVFMDDDNYAHPKQVETFIRAITTSSYDALSCALVVFDAEDDPADLKRFIHLYIPAGSGTSLNLFSNSYGDANGIYRKSALQAVGGLTEDRLSWEDYELFSKLEQNGFRVGVIPEPLVYLRASIGSVSRRGSMLSNHYRALRPALKNFPWSTFGDALLIALSPRLQAANAVRFEPDDMLDDRRILYNSESALVVSRLLVERASNMEGIAAAARQLGRLVSASKTLSHFGRDFLFTEVSAILSSAAELGGVDKTDFSLAKACAEIFKRRSFKAISDFILEHNISAPLPDVIFMDGLLNLFEGRPADALHLWAAMLSDADAKYLKNNPDIDGEVKLKHLRSGIEHFIRFGYNEYRQFEYHHPLRGPLASDCRNWPVDYEFRLQEILQQSAEDGAPGLQSLLVDIISGGSVVVACHLACVLLSEAEPMYLNDNQDVARAVESGGFRDASAHWFQFGIDEVDRFHLIYSIDGSAIESKLFDKILGPRIVHESAAFDFQSSQVNYWLSSIGCDI